MLDGHPKKNKNNEKKTTLGNTRFGHKCCFVGLAHKVDFAAERGLKGRGKQELIQKKDQSPNLHMQINDIKSGRILKYRTNSLLCFVIFLFLTLRVTRCLRNCFCFFPLELHLKITKVKNREFGKEIYCFCESN